MSKEIKNGDMVFCCDNLVIGDWDGPFRFVGFTANGFSVVEAGIIRRYLYSKIAQEKTYKPFTQETFPRCLMWIRDKASTGESLVTKIGVIGVMSGSTFFDFKHLLTDCEISIDECKTWNPAGEQS